MQSIPNKTNQVNIIKKTNKKIVIKNNEKNSEYDKIVNWLSGKKLFETDIDMIKLCLEKYPQFTYLFRSKDEINDDEIKKYSFYLSFNPNIKFEDILHLDNEFKTNFVYYSGLCCNLHNLTMYNSFIEYLRDTPYSKKTLFDFYKSVMPKGYEKKPYAVDINEFIKKMKNDKWCKNDFTDNDIRFSYYEEEIVRFDDNYCKKIKYSHDALCRIAYIYATYFNY